MEEAVLLRAESVGSKSPFPPSAARNEALEHLEGRSRLSVLSLDSGTRSGRIAPDPLSAARNVALAVRAGNLRLCGGRAAFASGAISGKVEPFVLSAARKAALAVLLGNFFRLSGGVEERAGFGLRSAGADPEKFEESEDTLGIGNAGLRKGSLLS